jgi:hypothetical protein
MLTTSTQKNGNVQVMVDGHLVITIDETSDDETINLFLYPENKAEIVETDGRAWKPWSHEVLMRRPGI